MHLRHIAALTLLLAFGNAMADDTSGGLQDKPAYVAMKAQVMKDLQGGKQYKEMSPEDQKTLTETFARMDARWDAAADMSQLSQEQRVQMLNDQEVVVTITTHAAKDSRVICERIEPINSHMPTKVCKTLAQIRRETENAQDNMRKGTNGTN